jgi:hypothetical protein
MKHWSRIVEAAEPPLGLSASLLERETLRAELRHAQGEVERYLVVGIVSRALRFADCQSEEPRDAGADTGAPG